MIVVGTKGVKQGDTKKISIDESMSIAEREQQILRVKKQGFHKELDEALADKLKTEVVSTVKTVLESGLEEKVKAFLKPLTGKERPYRSGYYHRGLNTQYGQIQDLAVPKLRQRNREREWPILQRYERSLGNLLLLDVLSIGDGTIITRFTRSAIFHFRQSFISERPDYPQSSTAVRSKAAKALKLNTRNDTSGWGLGRYSIHDKR